MTKKQKNKILHIDIEKGWGGGQRQVLLLLKSLPRENHFLICRSGTRLEQEAIKEKINIIPFKNFIQILYKLREKKFSIVQCHSSRSLNLGVLLKKIFNLKLFYTKRVFTIHKNLFSLYKLKQVDQFIAISKFIKQQLIKNGVLKKKITIIHSAVEAQPLKQKQRQNKKIIGSIGKLSQTKNHIVILKATKEFLKIRKDFLVYIIGEGSERKNLEEYIRKNKLKQYVKLLGYKKRALDYFNIFDVFVFPSKLEGLGTSVLDAMLYKVPVVASSAPAIPEIVKHKKTGLLFPPEDEKKLAQSINILFESTKLKKTLVNQASVHVKKYFSVPLMTKKYLKLWALRFSPRE